MAKTVLGKGARGVSAVEPEDAVIEAAVVAPPAPAAEHEDAGALTPATAAPAPWRGLKIAVIDDAIHPPRLDRLTQEGESEKLDAILATDAEITTDLEAIGCPAGASADERLRSIAEADRVLVSQAKIGDVSPDAARMIEEHRSFRRLMQDLQDEVAEVEAFDPFQPVPDLTKFNLVLLDYYLEGLAKGGERAVTIATAIRAQIGQPADQQIVLMSSIEDVRNQRGAFRQQTGLTGAAFAFISKPDLDQAWKIKAHLGMLERARPYSPAFMEYRAKLDESLKAARSDLLTLVDDMDIGDYAFLQSHALMKDGHPLGEYVFWLLSSQLLAFAFERDDMRTRQRELDKLEFVGEPFAATEPSTVVANLLHSALVSRNVGPLAAHPRAKKGQPFAKFPLVQLGDVFLNADRSKAVVVMSADCDLAFAPQVDRAPNAETPVMLVPGTPVKLRDAQDDEAPHTHGILHVQEVYRIVWDFAGYRSVELGKLKKWLKDKGFDTSNRDRLRPLFGLKLQQEFGAHLLRVGPPLMPPTTTGAKGRIFICKQGRDEVGGGPIDLMVTRFKTVTILRVTPRLASALRVATEDLHGRLLDDVEAAQQNKKANLQLQATALDNRLRNDDLWIDLLKGVELNAINSLKSVEPLCFVFGTAWTDPGKARVVLQIAEDDGPADQEVESKVAEPAETLTPEAGAVSAA